MSEEKITPYKVRYKDVLCTGVKWGYPEPNVFYFIKDGKEYEYTQMKELHCSSDIDHIRCVIAEQFLSEWRDERIKKL